MAGAAEAATVAGGLAAGAALEGEEDRPEEADFRAINRKYFQ